MAKPDLPHSSPTLTVLPWPAGVRPLMLAPMQGLTNRALRSLFVDVVRPDVVFTEFVRVRPGSKKAIADADRLEVADQAGGVPLVCQLIGRNTGALVAAAELVQQLGARHLNINLGCPFGRMGGNSAGGALLKDPTGLADVLGRLRAVARGSFSVKMRSGYDDPGQVLELLPVIEDAGVDFLILHARTVVQRYSGRADHRVTAAVVKAARIPVIANGDIFTAPIAARVLAETSAAGLMLGRGAIADPLLFTRIREGRASEPGRGERASALQRYLAALLPRYQELFCGEKQILCKLKAVVSQMQDEDLIRELRDLKRAKGIAEFVEAIGALG